MQQADPAGKNIKQRSLARSATELYATLAALGLGIHYFFHDRSLQLAWPPAELSQAADWLWAAFLTTLILLLSSRLLEEYSQSFAALRRYMTELLGPMSIPTAIYLALISAFAEELFFRAALQPWLGLVLTSILFGLAHIGPELRPSTWSVWAFVAGLMLGWIYLHTGSIWPPIAAHFMVNTFSLLRIRLLFRREQEGKT